MAVNEALVQVSDLAFEAAMAAYLTGTGSGPLWWRERPGAGIARLQTFGSTAVGTPTAAPQPTEVSTAAALRRGGQRATDHNHSPHGGFNASNLTYPIYYSP